MNDILDGNNLASKCPDLAKYWHPTRNGNLHPENVAPRSNSGDIHDTPSEPLYKPISSIREYDYLYKKQTYEYNPATYTCSICKQRVLKEDIMKGKITSSP